MLQLLLKSGLKESSLSQRDSKGRNPLDLISLAIQDTQEVNTLESGWALFSSGSGANFCLGSPAAGDSAVPNRVDAIHTLSSSKIIAITATKFHSCALNEDGEVFTWGWGGGKGPRLGHLDIGTHMAQILPRQVLDLPKIKSIAAGKHHTLASSANGEVWSWGSNSHGQLGYGGEEARDPRMIASLKGKIVRSVAASNVHSLALTQAGELLSWGSNSHGQLGYPLSAHLKGNPAADFKQLSSPHNPAFLYGVSPKNIRGAEGLFSQVPRIVDGLKGKRVAAVSCSKRHTAVVTEGGEVYSWGFRASNPKKVSLAPQPFSSILYHKGYNEMSRPQAVAIAAGLSHTSVITKGGRVLAWPSADPSFKILVISLPGGRSARSISAAKHQTTIVTTRGEVYVFEATLAIPSQDLTPPSSILRCSASSSSSSSFSGLITSKSPSHPQSSLSLASPPQPSHFMGSKYTLGSSPPNPSPFISPPSVQPFTPPALRRVEGIRQVEILAGGEKHAIYVVSYRVPPLCGSASLVRKTTPESNVVQRMLSDALDSDDEEGWQLDEEEGEEAREEDVKPSTLAPRAFLPLSCLGWEGSFESVHSDVLSPIPTLQTLCQMSVAKHQVEVRSALQVLEYADASGAFYLRDYCIAYSLLNLESLLLDSLAAFVHLPRHLVELMESRFKSWMAGAVEEMTGPLAPSAEAAPSTTYPKPWAQPFNQKSRRPTLFAVASSPEADDPMLAIPPLSPPEAPTTVQRDKPSSSSKASRVEVASHALEAVHALPRSPAAKSHSSHSHPFDQRPNEPSQLLNLNPMSAMSDQVSSKKHLDSGSSSISISAAAGGCKNGRSSGKKIALDVFLNGPSTSAPKVPSPAKLASSSPTLAAWSKPKHESPSPVTSPSLVEHFDGESRAPSLSLSTSLSKADKTGSNQPKEGIALASGGTFTLGDFFTKSQPKPSKSSPSTSRAAAWTSPAPSSSSSVMIGNSPPLASSVAVSLKRIQEEQERHKSCTSGASLPVVPRSSASSLMGSSPPASKWYVSDENRSHLNQSVQSIQEEEAAMNELRKMFPGATVRVKKS
jgi:hypothetical protein